MIQAYKGKSKGAFNADKNSPSTAALMIGVQTFDGMTRDDAMGYALHLGQTLKELRQNDIPVIWAMIDSEKGNKPFIPVSSATNAPRDIDELKETGIEGFDADQENHDIFTQFMREHGPRQNETIFRKSFMSALAEPSDANHNGGEAHKRALLMEAGIKIKGGEQPENPDIFREIEESMIDAEFMNFFRGEKTVTDYLKEKNINNTLIMGQVSYYCVLETAISAARKGFNPTIIGDRCLSWVYKDHPDTRECVATCVWQGTKDRTGNELYAKPDHEIRMRERINTVISAEKEIRGLTGNDIPVIRNINIKNASDAINHRLTTHQLSESTAQRFTETQPR